MTHATEGLIQLGLITLIGVNLVAGALLLQKLFSGSLGYRFRIRARIEDLEERTSIVESNLEALAPGKDLGPAVERNLDPSRGGVPYTEGSRDGQRRALTQCLAVLDSFEVEIGNSALYKKIRLGMTLID